MAQNKRMDFSKYDPRMVKLADIQLEAMLLGKKNKALELAETLGVSERTIFRWLKDEDYLEIYNYKYMLDFKKELPAVIRAQIEKAKAGNTKAAELIMKAGGLLRDIKVVEGGVEVNVAIEGSSNDDLKKRIAELERKALPSFEEEDAIDADFTIVEDSPNGDDTE